MDGMRFEKKFTALVDDRVAEAFFELTDLFTLTKKSLTLRWLRFLREAGYICVMRARSQMKEVTTPRI